MYRSFGAALDEFASSLDIADKRVLAEVDDLLKKYLLEEMGFDFYEVLVERWVGTEDGPERALTTLLCEGGRNFSNVPVQDGTANQTAYSFFKDRPLWITTIGAKPLKGRNVRYVDSWSDEPAPGLPPYTSGNNFRIKTSIIQPLKNGESAFGVINVESQEHRLCNRWAKDELQLVAKGVASIVGRAESHDTTRKGTDRSIARLRKFATRRWNPIRKPKLFVAYSEDADGDVVETMRKVVTQHDDHEVVFWKQQKESGDIYLRVQKWLRESRVVVCYLSEPTEEGLYGDNANVLVEAGIAQGLSSAWQDVEIVIIREDSSRPEEIPFDLRGHDVLKVPRNGKGKLLKNEFKKRLGERLTLASNGQAR